jgi:long-chain acyl-CoA synthetase
MAANLADYFTRHLARPGTVLYRESNGRRTRALTAGELARDVARWQAAFRRDGLVAGERVALCARNSTTWVAADLAALGMGLVVVPLYVEDNADNVAWCVADAEARIVIAENLRLAYGVRKALAATVPSPRIVILRTDEAQAGDDTIVPVERYLPAVGGDVEVQPLPEGTLATICYTSGTAGRPKGVMLSHGNIIADVAACAATRMARPTDVFLSILPLSHMFERTGGYYLPLSLGAIVAFSRGIARLPEDFIEQAPTAIFAVPRIFERIRARIERELATSPVRRYLFERCVASGLRIAERRAGPLEQVMGTGLRALVAAPLLAKFGGRLRLAVIGGAALDPELARTFMGLGLTMLQGYGLTEASPVIAVNRDDDNDPESVGPPLPGIEARIADGGELLARGANVMLGYWRNEAATRAALDADGWLHTGDLAELRGGRIYIRGRAKDILVMSNGEKLSPQDVELAILRDPVFEQVMVIGEGRPYPMLLAVSPEADEKALVRRANDQLKSFPRWVRMRSVIASRDPWTVENGLLTPTLKLKRPALTQSLKARIDAAYAALPQD